MSDQAAVAPICLFVYNRPKHTLQTLQSLKGNLLADQSVLYVFADGPKDGASDDAIKRINEVREIVSREKWCREVHVIISDQNKGLANSIIKGVTETVSRHGKVIVLEDDLLLSEGFLTYMNNALDFYENQEEVMHIAGFAPDFGKDMPETFFFPVPDQ
ncbi:glycosyltransferase family 2 protein [Bacteroidota bacterium]